MGSEIGASQMDCRVTTFESRGIRDWLRTVRMPLDLKHLLIGMAAGLSPDQENYLLSLANQTLGKRLTYEAGPAAQQKLPDHQNRYWSQLCWKNSCQSQPSRQTHWMTLRPQTANCSPYDVVSTISHRSGTFHHRCDASLLLWNLVREIRPRAMARRRHARRRTTMQSVTIQRRTESRRMTRPETATLRHHHEQREVDSATAEAFISEKRHRRTHQAAAAEEIHGAGGAGQTYRALGQLPFATGDGTSGADAAQPGAHRHGLQQGPLLLLRIRAGVAVSRAPQARSRAAAPDAA